VYYKITEKCTIKKIRKNAAASRLHSERSRPWLQAELLRPAELHAKYASGAAAQLKFSQLVE
jgi:hypothetical protein